ncbi:ChaN family lipoprotein, partial [Acinetobacter baumannii]
MALAACATAAPPLQLREPVVLLGEVHDNAAQHALRLEAFKALLDGGARPALALEQLDRDKQPAL